MAIKTSKKRKGQDFHGISAHIFELLGADIYPRIKKYIFDIFQTCVFPKWLNISRVIPIYKKKGKKDNVANYRPISICNSLSSIIEKVMYYCLTFYVDRINAISQNQYAFKANSSTNDALLRLVFLITKARENGDNCIVIFFDFKKAFDSVNQDILIEKISKLNIPNDLFKILSDWIKGKSFFIDVNGTYSTPKIFDKGIAQGSSLGPLLFNIYIDDLIQKISSITDVMAYADDIAVFVGANSAQKLNEKIRSLGDCMTNWCHDNRFSIL